MAAIVHSDLCASGVFARSSALRVTASTPFALRYRLENPFRTEVGGCETPRSASVLDTCAGAFGIVNITETSVGWSVRFATRTSKYATGSDVRRSSFATIGEKNRIETSVLNGS
jgi:hypothetical protein